MQHRYPHAAPWMQPAAAPPRPSCRIRSSSVLLCSALATAVPLRASPLEEIPRLPIPTPRRCQRGSRAAPFLASRHHRRGSRAAPSLAPAPPPGFILCSHRLESTALTARAPAPPPGGVERPPPEGNPPYALSGPEKRISTCSTMETDEPRSAHDG
jgi:hypothetical protein